eukprot:scaffold25193_cov29-Tisochrysis_lutea.AAC.4
MNTSPYWPDENSSSSPQEPRSALAAGAPLQAISKSEISLANDTVTRSRRPGSKELKKWYTLAIQDTG